MVVVAVRIPKSSIAFARIQHVELVDHLEPFNRRVGFQAHVSLNFMRKVDDEFNGKVISEVLGLLL